MPRGSDPKKLPPGAKLPARPEGQAHPQLRQIGTARPAHTGGEPLRSPRPAQACRRGLLEPKRPDTPKGEPSKGIDDPARTHNPGDRTAAPPAPALPRTRSSGRPMSRPIRGPSRSKPSRPSGNGISARSTRRPRSRGHCSTSCLGANGLDLDLQDDKGNSVWDLLRKGDGSGLAVRRLHGRLGRELEVAADLNFPSMKLGKWFGGHRPRVAASSSSSWNWGSSSSTASEHPRAVGSGFGSFGFGGSWFPSSCSVSSLLGILLWVLLEEPSRRHARARVLSRTDSGRGRSIRAGSTLAKTW